MAHGTTVQKFRILTHAEAIEMHGEYFYPEGTEWPAIEAGKCNTALPVFAEEKLIGHFVIASTLFDISDPNVMEFVGDIPFGD